MSLDRHAAERRRFARLLGTDGEHGSGLPIGERTADGEAGERDADDDDGVEREAGDAPSSDDSATRAPDR